MSAHPFEVTLAVVADKMISKGKDPNALTQADWLAEMKLLSEPGSQFDCLTGAITFDKNQERAMEMGVYNWHADSLVSLMVLKWNSFTGYKWVVGETVAWPSGAADKVKSASLSSITVPSGLPPPCSKGSVYDNDAMKCKTCPVKLPDLVNAF